MGLITLETVINGLKAIPTEKYSQPNELARLLFQSKTEYLLRDKLDLYFIDNFEAQGLLSIREWKNWEPWGLQLEHTIGYLRTTGREITVKELQKEWKNIKNELPEELQDFTWYKKGTAGVDLALFREYTDVDRENGEKRPFQLESVIEFKCEVLHQLNPQLLNNANYLTKDLERMKKFQMATDCSYYQILCLVDFPNGVKPKYYELNNHYKANAENVRGYSIPNMTNKLRDTFLGSYDVYYLSPKETAPIGVYLDSQIELHYWIISPFSLNQSN